MIDQYEKDNKIIQFFKENGKKLVFCNYINVCHMFYYKIDLDDFELNEEKPIINFIDLISIFNRHKERIIEFYTNKSEKNQKK